MSFKQHIAEPYIVTSYMLSRGMRWDQAARYCNAVVRTACTLRITTPCRNSKSSRETALT